MFIVFLRQALYHFKLLACRVVSFMAFYIPQHSIRKMTFRSEHNLPVPPRQDPAPPSVPTTTSRRLIRSHNLQNANTQIRKRKAKRTVGARGDRRDVLLHHIRTDVVVRVSIRRRKDGQGR